jgi:hypothetical protein
MHMQPNLAQFRSDAAAGFGRQPLAAFPVASRALRLKTRPPLALETSSPFSRCHGSLPPAKLLAEIRSVLETARDARSVRISSSKATASRRRGDTAR